MKTNARVNKEAIAIHNVEDPKPLYWTQVMLVPLQYYGTFLESEIALL